MGKLLVFIAVVALAGLGAWWIVGKRELAELRDSNAALTAQIETAGTSNPAHAEDSPASGKLTQEEQTELLRLRGQIQPLRRQVTDLSNRVASATSRR
jgi:hypothetical protein